MSDFSGNPTPFTIEINETAVNVRTTQTDFRLGANSGFAILILAALGIYALHGVLPSLTTLIRYRSHDIWLWVLTLAMILVGGSFLWQAFRSLFPSGESLVCDSATLTIGRIPAYAFNGHWNFESFSKDSVQQMKFTIVKFSRYGGTPGLTFRAGGKEYKTLYGLQIPEASVVLRGLSQLGVDTVHDPATPMMIEIALERRKSKLGIF